MKNDVKLKVAAEEIKEIMRNHDITGSVTLHAEDGFMEHFNHLNSSYSCVYITSDHEVRIHSKRKDYKTDEEQIRKIRESAGMLHLLGQGNGLNFLFMDQLHKKLEEKVEITHSDK